VDTVVYSAIAVAHGPGWNESGDWGGGWWIVGRLIVLVILIAAIALTVWWVRRSTARAQPSGIDIARGILAERYARGEIDTEEYHARREQLG